MSNVEYRCPKCGNRLFAPPGGTTIPCANHPDTIYEQTEEYSGPNFKYIEDGEKTTTKTGVVTAGVQHPAALAPEPPKKEMTKQETLAFLRDHYRRVSGGDRPDLRWGIDRLNEEIQAWETLNAAKAEEEEEDEETTSDEGEGDSDSDEGDEPDDAVPEEVHTSTEVEPEDETAVS